MASVALARRFHLWPKVHRSPAAALLNDFGVRLTDVAVVAQVSPAAVSRWLAGVYKYPADHFASVLGRFLEPSQTDRVLAMIPERGGGRDD